MTEPVQQGFGNQAVKLPAIRSRGSTLSGYPQSVSIRGNHGMTGSTMAQPPERPLSREVLSKGPGPPVALWFSHGAPSAWARLSFHLRSSGVHLGLLRL